MGTGGSRYGAGRPGWRRKCEHLLRLDIRALSHLGSLSPGMYSWSWSRGDEPAGNISIRVSEDRAQLMYKWTPHGGVPLSFDYPVWIDRTACHYGGSRPWFRCPRCYWRCAVLYGIESDGKFGCRRCMRLAYSSEVEDALGRMWRKQKKLEGRLADNHQRPRGMRQRTYNRILERIERVEEAKHAAFCLYAMASLERLGPYAARI